MSKKNKQRNIVLNSLNKQALISHKDLISKGISPTTVSRMVVDGDIIRVSRGLFQSKDSQLGELQGIAEAAMQIPNGVICLTSSLFLHGVIDEKPETIWVAVKKNSWIPKLDNSAIKVVQFTEKYLSQSIEVKIIQGIPIKVFGINRSIIDCFRLRNKVGIVAARKSLEQAMIKNYINQNEIFKFSQQGRVMNIVYPYLVMYCANSSIG